jgi:uncharacterized protein (TIGR04222 family)
MSTESSRWTESARLRWQRIERHPIGGIDAAVAFAQRLAREQGWDAEQTQVALREYRRFVFLSGVAGHEVTPSRAVDAVWHLHLLFTRDYWGAFAEALGAPLHHDPGIRPEDAPRHRMQYAQTLASYAHWFGPAPAPWWPGARPVAAAVSARAARHVVGKAAGSTRAVALALGALVPAVVWAARPADPLDWSGRDFLALYLALMAGAVVSGLVLRTWLRRSAVGASRHLGALTPTHAALLAGGPQRAIDAAVAELHERGAIVWDADQQRLVRAAARTDLPAPLPALLRALVDDHDPSRSTRAAIDALKPVAADLEKRGLWIGREAARRIGRIAALPALLVLGFGASKVVLGVMRDKPVSLLVALCVLTAIFAAAMYFGRPRRSRFGDAEVARLRTVHAAPRGAGADAGNLAYAVALGGTALFAGTALADWHQARAASSGTDSSTFGNTSNNASSSDSHSSGDSGSSSDSNDSGGDSGSSGCGGCGGGGGD